MIDALPPRTWEADVIVVQISDTHIEEAGVKAHGLYDTAQSLSRCLAAVQALDVKPDVVLHTGDLADGGTAASYGTLRGLLSNFPFPFYAIPGNHDDREPFRQAFSDQPWLPRTGPFINFTVDGPVRLVCLDSTIPGEVAGELCAERLHWLADRLAEAPGHPTIVALHHPPFATAMAGVSGVGLRQGGPELDALLRRYPNVQRVIAGHYHRAMTIAFGGTIGYAAPSAAYPFGLDMGPERILSLSAEPPGFAVHVWMGDAGVGTPGLITHTVSFGDWRAPIALRRGGQRMLDSGH